MINFNDFVNAFDGYTGSAEDLFDYLQDAVTHILEGKEFVDTYFLYSTDVNVLMVAQAYVHQLGMTLQLKEHEDPKETWDDPNVPEWGWHLRVMDRR